MGAKRGKVDDRVRRPRGPRAHLPPHRPSERPRSTARRASTCGRVAASTSSVDHRLDAPAVTHHRWTTCGTHAVDNVAMATQHLLRRDAITSDRARDVVRQGSASEVGDVAAQRLERSDDGRRPARSVRRRRAGPAPSVADDGRHPGLAQHGQAHAARLHRRSQPPMRRNALGDAARPGAARRPTRTPALA